ncbi:MAG: VOC family protein [Verrucomicrobia bacterium]|nr:VOC family protein [Cytophagales bacterium]
MQLSIQNLEHIAIQVADVEKSKEFYTKVLGLVLLPRPDFDFAGAWFALGSFQQLHLIGNRTEPVIAGSRSNHFALKVSDLDAFETHFKENGINFKPKKQRPDGIWQVFLTDPDGHCIELNA